MTRRFTCLALSVAFVLSSCGGAEEEAAADNVRTAAPQPAKAAVQTANLTGLYEGGDAPQRNQLCIIDRGPGNAGFGLVVWGEALHSCSGVGEAARSGEVLRLSMAGDEQCEIEARIVGGKVTLPDTLPEGCAYYCGARARMNGVGFDKVGGTAADAMRAADLVGDPLCGG